MADATEDMIGRVVRTVEHNTGNGGSDTISATHIRVHLRANASYPAQDVTQAIAAALERGDLVEHENGYATATPDTYRKYL